MIRIKDIADRAGVSPTTVSNVIHGKTGRVSKATVEKINRILKRWSTCRVSARACWRTTAPVSLVWRLVS
ncbi:MAG: LacI family DNA-binding transcriptional regulator [Fusicatenibacter saccharivorans]